MALLAFSGIAAASQFKQINVNNGTQVGWAYCRFNGTRSQVNQLVSQGWKIVSIVPMQYMANGYGQYYMCQGLAYTLAR